jgi:hypothetical protein
MNERPMTSKYSRLLFTVIINEVVIAIHSLLLLFASGAHFPLDLDRLIVNFVEPRLK